MRVIAATIGAVTLGSSVMAQSAPTSRPLFTTELKDLETLTTSGYDACHKLDSEWVDLISPCASQLKIAGKLCPVFAETEQERIDQRDCLCGEGSSFLQDAVACSECKIQNGLQPDVQRDYWIKYYNEVEEKYCRPKDVPLQFDTFRRQLLQKMQMPQGGRNINQFVNEVANPRLYYRGNVPKKQGAGKISAVNSDKNATVRPNIDPLAGQVKLPVYGISEMPTAVENKTEQPINPAPFYNSTTTVRPTASLPSTLITITTSNVAGAPTTILNLLPSSSVAPAPGTAPEPVKKQIVIDGKLCVVYIVWVIVDCTPKTDAAGTFTIGFETVGVDKQVPAVILENKEQFNKIKDAFPNAGKDQKLAEDVKQLVGTASLIIPASAAGNNQKLPPVQGSTGKTEVPSVSQPVNHDEECEVTDDAPQTPKSPNGGSNTIPVGQGSQPSTGPNSSSGPSKSGSSTPSKSGSSTPGKTGSTPAKSDSTPSKSSSIPAKSDSTPGKSGSSTCECDCPSTSANDATTHDRNPTDICKQKSETENRCNAMSGAEVKNCLCTSSFFFDQAIKCARRSTPIRNGEYEAQVLFEAKKRFCMQENTFGNNFDAAYNSVQLEWKDARAPNSVLI